MEQTNRIRALRELTGMKRSEFCRYFQIPYRTVSEWERDGRHAPDYLIRLLEYYIRMEMIGPDITDAESDMNLEASLLKLFGDEVISA